MLVAAWLIWRDWHALPAASAPAALPTVTGSWWWRVGWVLALLVYLLGRSQELIRFELLGLWLVLTLCLWAKQGPGCFRQHRFALLFLLLSMA